MPKPLSYRELGKRAHYSKTAFSVACAGDDLPTWDVTVAFLNACQRQVDRTWWTDWQTARAEAEALGLKVPSLPTPLPFLDAEVDGGEDESTSTGETEPTTAPTPSAATSEPAAVPASRTGQPVTRPDDEVDAIPGQTEHARSRARRLTMAGVVVAGLVVLVAAVLVVRGRAQPTTPTCDDIGVFAEGYDKIPQIRQAWQDAYTAGGGPAMLGCPLPDAVQGCVHEWGPGASQDLQDAQGHKSRLMSLHGDKVIAMTGTYWEDYTQPHFNLAAGRLGYPTSDPTTCGNTRVVLLDGGDYSPGALVNSPAGRFMWLPRPVWLRYLELGGPQGPLGRPLNSLNKDIEGEIEFENGSAIEMRNGAARLSRGTSVSPSTTAPTIAAPCVPELRLQPPPTDRPWANGPLGCQPSTHWRNSFPGDYTGPVYVQLAATTDNPRTVTVTLNWGNNRWSRPVLLHPGHVTVGAGGTVIRFYKRDIDAAGTPSPGLTLDTDIAVCATFGTARTDPQPAPYQLVDASDWQQQTR